MKNRKLVLPFAVAALFAGLAPVACDDSGSAVKEPPPSTTPNTDAGPSTVEDAATKDCFDNPKTHFEIINACTNATRISKNPVLNKLLPDGGLPPLN